MRKKKHILELDRYDDAEFGLIGICTHQADYRLVWAINHDLGMRFSKMPEKFTVIDKKGELVSEHEGYDYEDDVNRIKLLLLSNRADGKKFLIPEQQSIDFFLILFGNVPSEIQTLATKVKGVQGVLAVFVFDPNELESARSIDFE